MKGEFQYSNEWLDNSDSYPLDPVNLPLTPKRYYVHNLRNTFGVFSDAGPDVKANNPGPPSRPLHTVCYNHGWDVMRPIGVRK